jgi:hypothetical protein
MRVTPYRTTDNKVEGVVAALFDISDFRHRLAHDAKSRKRH